MKRKIWTRISCLLLGGMLCMSWTACDGTDKGGAGKGEADVFSAYVTDKILRDVPVEDSEKMPASFSYLAAQGESEAAQRSQHKKIIIFFCDIVENGSVKSRIE